MTRAVAAALIALSFTPGPKPPGLRDVLRRAAEYVRQFERDFAAVITDELYDQEDFCCGPRKARTVRHIRSEMLFMRLPGQGLSWLTARNVIEVDGQPVPDSRDRLERAMRGDASGLVSRVRSVANEGARFNLGQVQRNFNDPILPLLFVDPDYQWRFKFTLGPEEDVDGLRARRIDFRETAEPTIISWSTGGGVFTSGSLWVQPADGVVVRTTISATAFRIEVFEVRVDYRRDPKLDMWIPARMTELYRQPGDVETISCIATYSNPRRFETAARIVR